jgi:hypothetical protein
MMKAEEATATRTELSIVFSLALGAWLVAEAQARSLMSRRVTVNARRSSEQRARTP